MEEARLSEVPTPQPAEESAPPEDWVVVRMPREEELCAAWAAAVPLPALLEEEEEEARVGREVWTCLPWNTIEEKERR